MQQSTSYRKTYGQNWFEQASGDAVAGTSLGANSSVTFTIILGSAVIYGSTTAAHIAGRKFVIDPIRHAIHAGLRDARKRGIAATQVDGVGHSMGGIVLRAHTAYQLDPYKKRSNYFLGDLHKIISVGSPHQGSPVVIWLIDHRCDRFGTLGTWKGREWIERVFDKMRKPMGPAIYGFQLASTPLKNIGKTEVPAHANHRNRTRHQVRDRAIAG